mmetsp:Transcript_6471/g.18968  ORF Transcript_6471/g.18968 Transcript_6471/m.18968 type:complete len:96 (+) Transcript_6471:750-1037(+)
MLPHASSLNWFFQKSSRHIVGSSSAYRHFTADVMAPAEGVRDSIDFFRRNSPSETSTPVLQRVLETCGRGPFTSNTPPMGRICALVVTSEGNGID